MFIIFSMVKKKVKTRKVSVINKDIKKRNILIAIVIIVLLLAAFSTGLRTNFYGVAVGILIGFLLAPLVNKLRTK